MGIYNFAKKNVFLSLAWRRNRKSKVKLSCSKMNENLQGEVKTHKMFCMDARNRKEIEKLQYNKI